MKHNCMLGLSRPPGLSSRGADKVKKFQNGIVIFKGNYPLGIESRIRYGLRIYITLRNHNNI